MEDKEKLITLIRTLDKANIEIAKQIINGSKIRNKRGFFYSIACQAALGHKNIFMMIYLIEEETGMKKRSLAVMRDIIKITAKYP